jgi:hypothetical protein
MKRMLATSLIAVQLTGCAPHDPELRQRTAEADAGLGRCTQEEPGAPPKTGNSVFYVDHTATAGGSLGSYAVMLSCLSPGPGGAAVTLIIPNLADSTARTGRYRVQPPGLVPPGAAAGSLAWAQAEIPARAGVTYRGMAGEVVVEKSDTGGLVGSYLLALERAPEAPQVGPGHLVLGGAFASPRNVLPRSTAVEAPRR